MRFVFLSLACAVSCCLMSSCASASRQKEMAEDIKKLRIEVATLKENVSAAKTPIAISPSPYITQSRVTETVANIKFPAVATEENLKNYINEILVASQGTRSYSTQDPQIAMLALVGPENLKLLIDAMPSGPTGGLGYYYLENAIKQLAGDLQRDLILEALPVKQRLASVVLDKGWARDAKDVLIAELQGSNGAYLPIEWVKAAATLQDPATYGALTEYLAKASSPAYVYQAIYLLPGIQLDEAVSQAWDKAKDSGADYTAVSMAAIAIAYGHQDAAEKLIECLKNPPARTLSSTNPRLPLIMHLDVSGTNEEIIAWYEANKDNLVFDPESKKFKVKG